MIRRILPGTRAKSLLSGLTEQCDGQECHELHSAKTRLEAVEKKAEDLGRPERRAEPRVFAERHQFS